MVNRVFVEKKLEFANESKNLKEDINKFLGIKNLENIRIINRYDIENIDQDLFKYSVKTVFSEPQLDDVYYDLNNDGSYIFCVEYLPGQFDQRADSAMQCIQIISQKEKPLIKTAKIYILYGELTESEVDKIKKYLINPVESREASLEKKETLKSDYEKPKKVKNINNFINFSKEELNNFLIDYKLAMDLDDIIFCQEYFKKEDRNPTITEIRMIDTYWSDHCRHTTFLTTIDSVKFEDSKIEKTYQDYIETREFLNRKKPINLMDLATISMKYLKKIGKLDALDESDEINACTVNIKLEINGKKEDWLLLFKNETHNHPTEIEPFGGAATCIGGAIRDPLSGRAYVYAAMRVSGAGDPTKSVKDTIQGKLPQRKICQISANGYSSYGNQIGLATGLVDEIYHDGYIAKRMEIGAVVAATKKENVKRIKPKDGDIIVLIGGKTGRDGCGGATGSSKSHNIQSIELCGSEVQKGNAPEERKLQRLFRNGEAAKLIKKCNDFGAGGISVAIGELADGLTINLDKVSKKYDGLDGTELAISESQERMACVIDKADVKRFIELANNENLEAIEVAKVTNKNRLEMYWENTKIVDLSRDFLNSNGAEKHVNIIVEKGNNFDKDIPLNFIDGYKNLLQDLNVCSKRGLSERFDSTIGANTVLMPFGGKKQLTPIQTMVHKISNEDNYVDDCSLMSYGYNPYISEKSPYHGAYLAVCESISKLIATGSSFSEIYLTFQEYFERLNKDPKKWGKPFSALLGAFKAQKDLNIASIGGKDSMSGTFENINVPPTLVSFAITKENIDNIISNEFKNSDNYVYLLKCEFNDGLPIIDNLVKLFNRIHKLITEKRIVSCYTPTYGGIAEAIFKMCLGNSYGFTYSENIELNEIFKYNYCSFIVETNEKLDDAILLGKIEKEEKIKFKNDEILMKELFDLYENKLEKVYPCNINANNDKINKIQYNNTLFYKPNILVKKPKVLIPVFPGTNCEYDTKKIIENSGMQAKTFIINNLSQDNIKKSIENFANEIKNSQIIFIPGGFSGGDEPDGSAKFITSFFRNLQIKEEIENLLYKKDGLMCGICNGFQALIKLGLLPYGKIIEPNEKSPTLTFNKIGRHQSKIVRTRICSTLSPWLSLTKVNEVYNVPISHGEGRFIADSSILEELIKNGQIATQYVDLNNTPTYDINYNPNGSTLAIEGITSKDGRIFGKMGHSERIGNDLYKNVYGKYDIKMFEAAKKYFE